MLSLDLSPRGNHAVDRDVGHNIVGLWLEATIGDQFSGSVWAARSPNGTRRSQLGLRVLRPARLAERERALESQVSAVIGEVGEAFRGQPAFGRRNFFCSTSEADRWGGCFIGCIGRAVRDTGSGRVVAAMAGRTAIWGWPSAAFWLRGTRTRPEVVHRFTMSVFAHSPQSQKNLLGKDLIANPASSGRN